MTDNKNTILKKLQNKSILFVEDRKSTIQGYLEELESLGIPEDRLVHRRSLQAAWNELHEKGADAFALILLDLNIPPIPPQLEQYKQDLRPGHLTQGQAFGIWLSENHPKLPYAYLTAYVPALEVDADHVYRQKIEKKGGRFQQDVTALDKYKIAPADFPAKLCEVWAAWPD